ncbi:MAG: NAD-dependent epimerase [Elusimicrobiota bacterium]|nr:MAG: NAD-dependent epimerase [Elusimicrobiota bacterium]
MKILVTGAAGFIGSHVARRLLERGDEVVGLDNLNSYYDPKLKRDRLKRLEGKKGFSFVQADLADRAAMEELFRSGKFSRVVHLGAQAGVRHSITNPHVFVDSNVTGTLHVLEGCRHAGVEHLVFASTSSVYGLNGEMPFSPKQGTAHPISLYAATKKANEVMAHSYAHLYRLPVTGLRFFTVYGPWGRPDMALFLFTKAILAGEPIDLFNGGDMVRDFTYVDDIAEGVVRTLDRAPAPDPAWDPKRPDPSSSSAPYRLYNIGNNNPVKLKDFIAAIEKATGKAAKRNLLPMQPGDVPATCADVGDLMRDTGFKPATSVEAGVAAFVRWYREYYNA